MDEVFVISGVIIGKASVISRGRRPRLISLASTLIIPDITKTEFSYCFITIVSWKMYKSYCVKCQ